MLIANPCSQLAVIGVWIWAGWGSNKNGCLMWDSVYFAFTLTRASYLQRHLNPLTTLSSSEEKIILRVYFDATAVSYLDVLEFTFIASTHLMPWVCCIVIQQHQIVSPITVIKEVIVHWDSCLHWCQPWQLMTVCQFELEPGQSYCHSNNILAFPRWRFQWWITCATVSLAHVEHICLINA